MYVTNNSRLDSVSASSVYLRLRGWHRGLTVNTITIHSYTYTIYIFTTLYLKEGSKFWLSSHVCSSSDRLRITLSLSTQKTGLYGRSFTVEAARLWNKHPISIRHPWSVSVFKIKSKIIICLFIISLDRSSIPICLVNLSVLGM